MSPSPVIQRRILAIDPTTKGFGFAVMEGPVNLVDWGVKEAGGRDKNAGCLKLVSDLIEHHQPEVVVVEDPSDKGSRRCARVRSLIRQIQKLASKKGPKTYAFSRPEVREAFSRLGARTKHEIATAIAKQLPELEPRLPPFRHPWMPEDYRMAIFDAVALTLTLYHFENTDPSNTLKALGINSSNHGK